MPRKKRAVVEIEDDDFDNEPVEKFDRDEDGRPIGTGPNGELTEEEQEADYFWEVMNRDD